MKKTEVSVSWFQKNLLAAVLLGFTVTGLNAQSVMVRAGINHSNFHFEDDEGDYTDELYPYIGGQIAGLAEFQFGEVFALETGLVFGTKGTRIKEEYSLFGQQGTYRARTMLVFAEIPVNVKVGFDAGDVRVVFHAGPSIGFGLFGSIRTSWDNANGEDIDSEPVDWGSGEEDDFRRLDFGAQIGGGVEFNQFYGGLQYSHGFANIAANQDDGRTLNNRTFSLMFGYKFDLSGGQ